MRGWGIICLGAIGCAAIAVEPLPLADMPGVTIVHYDVTGDNPAQVRAAIDRARPVDPNDSQRVDALTHAAYTWRWPGDGKGGCDLRRAEIGFRATVTMPRLADDARLSSGARKRWDNYIAALARHEAGHVALAHDRRGALADAIAAATCATANAAAMRVLAAITAAHVDYDRRTRHGMTDGAPFP